MWPLVPLVAISSSGPKEEERERELEERKRLFALQDSSVLCHAASACAGARATHGRPRAMAAVMAGQACAAHPAPPLPPTSCR